MRAILLIKREDPYPHHAVELGLLACGFKVSYEYQHHLEPDDVAVTWTPWDGTPAGVVFERYPRQTIVLENGYMTPSADGTIYYCVGLGGFNGIGTHRNSNSPADRFSALGFPVLPMKKPGRGSFSLVIAQSGGDDTRWTMPRRWLENVMFNLRKKMECEVRLRPHPNRPKQAETWRELGFKIEDGPVIDVLTRTWSVFTWNSKLIAHAGRLGCQVYVAGENSVLYGNKQGATSREQWLYDLAYAQWTADEIAMGYPFRRLLWDSKLPSTATH